MAAPGRICSSFEGLARRRVLGALVVGAALLALAIGVLTTHSRTSTALPPLDYWYWHHPFALSPAKSAELKRLGVTRLSVFAGDLYQAERGFTVSGRAEWKTGSDLPVVLVFRAGTRSEAVVEMLSPGDEQASGSVPYSEISDFLPRRRGTSPERLADGISAAILSEVKRAESRGVSVTGIQLDFDTPTRLLRDYAALLAALRPRLGRLQLTIAALPTWLGSPDFRTVASAVDSYTMMLYGLRAPRPLAWRERGTSPPTRLDGPAFPPITELRDIAGYIRRAEAVGRPYGVGLAAFGAAISVDGGMGSVVHFTTWRERTDQGDRFLNVAYPKGNAARYEPQLRFLGDPAYRWAREENAMTSGSVYLVTEPGRLRAAAREAQRAAGRHLSGITIFRMPIAGEPFILTPQQVRRALGREPLRVDLVPSVRAARLGGSRVAELSIRNRGLAGPRAARGSVVVEVTLSRHGLEVADPGQFDGVEYFSQSHGRRQTASLARANTLRFTAPYLEPGASVSTGPLLLADGQARMTVRVSYRDPASGRRVTLPEAVLALGKGRQG